MAKRPSKPRSDRAEWYAEYRKTKVFRVQIPDENDEIRTTLVALSKQHGLSRSDVIRNAVRYCLLAGVNLSD